MGNIQLPGLSTGIDSTKIIQQLMAVEERRLASYQVDKKQEEEKATALDELRSQVSSFESQVKNLSDADSLQLFKTSSSDEDILELTANSNAAAGSHSIKVNQLATAETWVHDSSTFTRKTDLVGAGKFIYSYNNKERVITTVGGQPTGNTTLQDLVNMINNDDENPGVTASLLYHDDKYHLVLSGDDTGSDYQISINSSTTNVITNGSTGSKFTVSQDAELSNKIVNLFEFSGSLAGGEKIIINDTSGTPVQVGEVSVTSDTDLSAVVEQLNTAFSGTATAKLENGKIIMTDDGTGDPFTDFELVFDNAGSTAALDLSHDYEFSITGDEAETSTKLTKLNQFYGELEGGETITVEGTDHNNSAIGPLQMDVTEETDILHLVDAINEAYSGVAKATFEDGKILLTDLEDGTSSTTLNLTFNNNGSGASFEVPTFSNTSEGGTEGGQYSGEILSEFDPDTATYVETQSAQNAEIKVDGYPTTADEWIESSSNTVSDVLAGVTLELNDITDAGEPVQVTINRNTGAIKSRIEKMIKSYNKLVSFLEDKTEYNPDTEEMGILSRDATASFLETQIRNPFLQIASGFQEGKDSFVRPEDLGIDFAADGTMELDSDILEDAIKEDYDGVLSLLGATAAGSSDSSNIKYYSSAEDFTEPGEYDVKVECDSNGDITGAWIKLASESDSEYRAATWNDNVITAEAGSGDDANPERGLQLLFEWDGEVHDSSNPLTANVRVKEGFAGTLEEILDGLTKTGSGRLALSENVIESKISQLEDKISDEQDRLDKIEERYNKKFARLEKNLSLMQQQFGALNMLNGPVQ